MRGVRLAERISMTTTRDPVTTGVHLSAEERVPVIDQLERMLASPLFSQSKRYAPFLRHVVHKTLEGQEDSLKERLLGVDVFGRAPDYDSNNDPIVRVTAGEVRKRIAQYYHDPAHQNELWIDLPTGTYVAQFRALRVNEENGAAAEPPILQAAPAVSQAAPAVSPEFVPVAPVIESVERVHAPGKRLTAAIIVLAVLASAGLVWKFGARNTSPLDRVWGNLVSSRSPSVIGMGEPYLYPPENKTDELSARQHLRSVYVTYSELQALVRLVRLLDSKRAVYSVQPASGTSFADLRQAPAILLGGLDNPWTMRAQQNLRFRLESDGNGFDWISDTRDPGVKKWFVDFNRPYSKVTTDFAIIAHFRAPNTQQPTLIVAGLGENGTKAASEFITDDAQLKNALGESLQKPGDCNFEVVITTEVINGSSGAPKVLAKEVW
jgi:hypothetical protein